MSKKALIALSLLTTCAFLGCDLLDSAKDSFSKKDQTATQTVQPQKTSNKLLPANTLVRIGSWTLTSDEFQERLVALKEIVPDYDINDPQAKRLVLDELIRQQLIVVDAEQSGLAREKDIVSAVDEFRRTLLVREAARKITEGLEVSDREARDFYEENRDQIVQPFQYRVSEIVVSDKGKAFEIYAALLKGGDFAEAARTHSTSASASAGGDLGFLEENPFPAMVDAILAIENQGDISEVFEGPDGFYIVKLDEKKGGEQISFNEVKDDIIRNRTLFKQQQAILDYINDLRTKINVEINEDLL